MVNIFKGQVVVLLDISIDHDESGNPQTDIVAEINAKLPNYLVTNSDGLISAAAIQSVGEFRNDGVVKPIPAA